MSNMSNSINQHLERYLGLIARGWAPAGALTGIQICLFENRPIPDVVTYSTLGLSRHVLGMPRGREVRQELLLSVAASFVDDDLSKLLAHVAEEVLRGHQALLRGQVLSLGHPVSSGSNCSSLYVGLPVVFPEEFATCADTQPSTVFAWLLPIHPTEAALLRQLGWSEFENRLERADLDVFDLQRTSII
jgi:hypothetical protein